MSGKAGGGRSFTATITITKKASASYKMALGEIKAHERSTISIKETPSVLRIDVAARDPAALRATINSVLKDLQVADSVSRL